MEQLPVSWHWGSADRLTATFAVAALGDGVVEPGRHELNHDTPLRILANPGNTGTLNFFIDFLAEKPGNDVIQRWQPKPPIMLPIGFECDEAGDLRVTQGVSASSPWGFDFTLEVQFFSWADHQLGGPHDVGFRATPSEIRVLHIVMDVNLHLVDKGKNGDRDFTCELGTSSFGAPVLEKPGSTDKSSAYLGRMIVELVQPVSKVQGIRYAVQFDVDRSQINPAEGLKFNRFLNESIALDVRFALLWNRVNFRGEARASATYHGPAVPGRKLYNQELSERRRKAVLDSIRKAGFFFTEPTLSELVPVGDKKARKLGEEDPWERRCELYIDGPELIRAVQQLWLSNRYPNR